MGQGTVIERDVREIHFSMFFFPYGQLQLLQLYGICVFNFFSRAFHEIWRSLACGMPWHFCLDVTLQGELMLETMAKSWWAGHGSLICTKRRGRHKCRDFFSIE